MREIQGKAKSVRELLNGGKYAIDYYQREYRWERKQVRELLDDLTGRFLEDYEEEHIRKQVNEYGHYFLGSIIISIKDGSKFIVDGQQRLTSLTLLLIYLNNLQQTEDGGHVQIDQLIYSEQYGEKSFNIDVEERAACMRALFDGDEFDATESPESVQNIMARYEDIQEYFSEEIRGKALPFFIDWVIDNVHLVEITAFSDEDAYTIFETMNDRGLSLTPTEMLKGFLLANISDEKQKTRANNQWKRRIQQLNEHGKDYDADTIKAWLRSQHAETIRSRRKGAKPEDFDRIGTEFHRWVRDYRDRLGLDGSDDFFRFIERDFDFYARQYMRLLKLSNELTPGFEPVFYNAQHGFTIQYHVLLAPITPGDPLDAIDAKIRLVATYLDIWVNRRIWNFRSISYSTVYYTMFLLMRELRDKSPEELAALLRDRLDDEEETIAHNNRLRVHQQNRPYIHRILARITDFIEQRSGQASRYLEYTQTRGKNRYEVEHIWADMPDRHSDEFAHVNDFREYRDRIGGLLLLPKSFNASYGALTYEEKLPHYYGQNLLAKSLHRKCYEHNPGFLKFVDESGLPFEPHPQFKLEDFDQRQNLYRRIAEHVWSPERLVVEQGLAL